MDLMEYKAKELFGQYGLPIGEQVVVRDLQQLPQAKELRFPLMVKAQVPVGGRGKAGGIQPAANEQELEQHAARILGMDIKGHTVKTLLLTRLVDIDSEWYLSILLDRDSKRPVIIFSSQGGMDIEDVARRNPRAISRLMIRSDIGLRKYGAQYLLNKQGIDSAYLPAFWELLQKLYRLFCAYDCTLCEINPVGVLAGGKLAAVDAKVSIDDSALYRHADILAFRDEMENDANVLEARKFNFLYIPCDARGSIAVISNGSGMIMSCIDLLAKNGLNVKAALDLGGGATADRICEAVRIVLSNSDIKALFINIFGGITRCDEVAGGIRRYVEEYDTGKIIVARFEGTNKSQGIEVMEQLGKDYILFADGLYEGVQVLVERRDNL